MALVFGWPMLRYGWLSLHADSVLTGLQPVPNGGANWTRLVLDDRFWQDVLQTSRFALVSVGLELVLALGIALLLDQRWRGRGGVRAITLLPWALPTTDDGPGLALDLQHALWPTESNRDGLGWRAPQSAGIARLDLVGHRARRRLENNSLHHA